MGLGYGREIRSGTLDRSIKTGALSPGCQNKNRSRPENALQKLLGEDNDKRKPWEECPRMKEFKFRTGILEHN